MNMLKMNDEFHPKNKLLRKSSWWSVPWHLTIPFISFFFFIIISLQLCVNLLQYGICISILKFKQSKYFEWLLTFYKTNVFYCFSRYNNHGRQTFKSIKLLSFPLQSEMRVTILFVLFKKLTVQSLTRNTML